MAEELDYSQIIPVDTYVPAVYVAVRTYIQVSFLEEPETIQGTHVPMHSNTIVMLMVSLFLLFFSLSFSFVHCCIVLSPRCFNLWGVSWNGL